jgi:hypothetical protein
MKKYYQKNCKQCGEEFWTGNNRKVHCELHSNSYDIAEQRAEWERVGEKPCLAKDEIKKSSGCKGTIQLLENFKLVTLKDGRTYYRRQCSRCSSEVGRISKLKREYKLTVEEYDDYFELIGKCCEICGDSTADPSNENRRLYVDHDHYFNSDSAGRQLNRGLLCTRCNNLLGGRGVRDRVDILENAIKYLERSEKARGILENVQPGVVRKRPTGFAIDLITDYEKDPDFGKTYSKEISEKLSNRNKGKPLSETHKKKISKGAKGRVIPKEHREKTKKTMTGLKHNKITCPVCGHKVGIRGAEIYHFDNCKYGRRKITVEEGKEFFTTNEVSKILGLNPLTVQRKIKEGWIEGSKITNIFIIPVDKFIEKFGLEED